MKCIRLRLLVMLLVLFIQILIDPKEVLRYLKEAMMIRDYRRAKYSNFKILNRAGVVHANLKGE